jgi:glutaminyl-peptide cyclotransferase
MCKSNRLRSLYALTDLCLYLTVCNLGFTSAPLLLARNSPPRPKLFQGSSAFADTKHAVSFGERPAGSDAIVQLRQWILAQLKPTNGEISLDSFNGYTPNGPVPMVNIILKFPGTSGKAIAVTGHYDTKKIPMVHFVGANDGGSSTGFLIEFARAVSKIKHRDDLYIVFFDGEEAVATWTIQDSLYGSRHLASRWSSDGTLSRLKALINIDMIGDKDLDITNDSNSSQTLRSELWGIAAKLGYAQSFRKDPGAVDDDHMPFVNAGVNAIDIIDMTYGPVTNNSSLGAYWHNASDTPDKLGAQSFQVVGDVVLELVRELDLAT